jgi:hypothetical protein
VRLEDGMSADLRCTGCNETPTRLATLKANPKVSRLTCENGVFTYDRDLWALRNLTDADFGRDPLPRGRKAVTA